ncbi:N-acetylserotonin O-methyltransferase-like protein [Selaginella moellendorffii]|nr:N-acetylserotonin O-methyltransferase-like protein [Selaginella moellendorffii]XP_024524349.1 N-acetylserotonin O-methyltransferase-like protein [Selaginella moellendorffii]|eukprot:XP_002963282.2 N-acetylserotonin O-methyltransferase-like protein [Selaginella moellendorffii]
MLIRHTPLLLSKRIVLASASPRRFELFQRMGLKVEVIPSTFEETLDKLQYATPGDYAAETATHKAIEVSRRLIQLESQRNVDLIVGADTVVELDGMILEKPRDEKDAFRMLSLLSGRQHKVYTGVVILLPHATDPTLGQAPLLRSFYEETAVEFGNLDEATITAYIATGEPMDKAGSYGIQDAGASLVKSVNGCFYNVVGFPIHRFCLELESLIGSGMLRENNPAPTEL